MATYKFSRTEEKTECNEIAIEAESLEEAVAIFRQKRNDGSFFYECEQTFEGVTDSWEEVELPDGSTQTL